MRKNQNYLDQELKRREIFRDTRVVSHEVYGPETQDLIRTIEVYADPVKKLQALNQILKFDHYDVNTSFIKSGTIGAAINLYLEEPHRRNRKIAILNFADAKRPGGWVVNGAPTQEEDICRCSNMYEALTSYKCRDYYFTNDIYNNEGHFDEAYTNYMIYLNKATVFKNDIDYNRLEIPAVIDIITSPAPCGSIPRLEEVLQYRMAGIILAAAAHGITHLILGAWGCGAFGQSPVTVAQCFAEVIYRMPVVPNIIFAIKETVGKGSYTLDQFSASYTQRIKELNNAQ